MRRTLALAVSGAVPLALYLVTLSGGSYWLDGGEFVAAAINLDIAHPPGHPLTALYGKLFSLLPLGPIAFRIALGQAVAAAFGAACLFSAGETLARSFGLRAARLLLPLALLGAWLAAFGYAIWFQAIRPEVYALQAALLFFAFERMARFVAGGAEDTRLLYMAAFAVGLGLTNHHLMAFFMFPALLGCAAASLWRRGPRPALVCAGFGLLALAVYAYLPLRALQKPPENLGDPVTLERIYWVISARVYAREMGAQSPEPLGERFAQMGLVAAEQLLYVLVPAAALGLYVLLRRRESRGLGALLCSVAGPVLLIRPWLGPVRGNPDAIAYLTAGLGALCLLVTAAFAALAALAVELGVEPRRIAWALYALVAIAIGFELRENEPRFDLAGFHATEPFDEYRMRVLPPRSVVIATTPQTVFRALELAASERVRPDLELVPLPFLRYPGVAEALIARNPELRRLVGDYLAHDRLERTNEPMGLGRPLLIELDPHVARWSYRRLSPSGLLYAEVGTLASQARLASAAERQQQLYTRIDRELGSDRFEIETAHQLLFLSYMDAVFYVARGERELAAASAARGLRLFPRDAQLGALARALAAGQMPDVERLLSFGRRSLAPR